MDGRTQVAVRLAVDTSNLDNSGTWGKTFRLSIVHLLQAFLILDEDGAATW